MENINVTPSRPVWLLNILSAIFNSMLGSLPLSLLILYIMHILSFEINQPAVVAFTCSFSLVILLAIFGYIQLRFLFRRCYFEFDGKTITLQRNKRQEIAIDSIDSAWYGYDIKIKDGLGKRATKVIERERFLSVFSIVLFFGDKYIIINTRDLKNGSIFSKALMTKLDIKQQYKNADISKFNSKLHNKILPHISS